MVRFRWFPITSIPMWDWAHRASKPGSAGLRLPRASIYPTHSQCKLTAQGNHTFRRLWDREDVMAVELERTCQARTRVNTNEQSQSRVHFRLTQTQPAWLGIQCSNHSQIDWFLPDPKGRKIGTQLAKFSWTTSTLLREPCKNAQQVASLDTSAARADKRTDWSYVIMSKQMRLRLPISLRPLSNGQAISLTRPVLSSRSLRIGLSLRPVGIPKLRSLI